MMVPAVVRIPTGLEGFFLEGLGASCPEGSSTKYTGVLVPGTDCRCSPGRVVHNGYCQSPEGVAQQEAYSASDYASMSVAEQMAQPLSDYAKKYFAQSKTAVSCKLVYPTTVPGGPNHPTNMCSIDGGGYVHGAFAINLNPGAAIVGERQLKAANQVSQATGIPPGAVASTPELQAAVNKAATGTLTNEEAAMAAESARLKQQLRDSLVDGEDYNRADGTVSWRTEIAGSGYSSVEMVKEALKAPPGFKLSGSALPSGQDIPSTFFGDMLPGGVADAWDNAMACEVFGINCVLLAVGAGAAIFAYSKRGRR